MPAPGQGSLRNRFKGSKVAGKVLAKTGWIRGASTLSGYVDGRPFSILMSYDPARNGLNRKLKALQDRMVAAMAAVDGS